MLLLVLLLGGALLLAIRNPFLGVSVLSVGLIAMGGHGLLEAPRVHEVAPTTVTCAEALRARPKQKWLRLTQCHLDLGSIKGRRVRGLDTSGEVYLTLGAPDSFPSTPARIVLVSQERETRRLADALLNASAEEEDNVLAEHASALERLSSLTGLVEAPSRAAAKALSLPDDAEPLLLREGAAPVPQSRWGAVLYLVFGAGLALFALPLYLRSRRLTPPPPSPVAELHPEVEPQLGELEALRREEREEAERARREK